MTASGASRHPREIIGENIRRARTARDLSQKELGRLVNDVDSMAVSNWERGINRPSDANLEVLASVLDVSLAWLYTEHSEEPVA